MKSIQSEWPIKKLLEVVIFNPKVPKGAIADSQAVVFVPMAAVGPGSNTIDLSQRKIYSEVKKGFTPFCARDVLFAKITPCMENGKSCVVPSIDTSYAFGSTEFYVLRCGTEILPEYLYFLISSVAFRKKAAAQMTGAVGQQRVPLSFLQNIEISLPPLSEQQAIASRLGSLKDSIRTVFDQLERIHVKVDRYHSSVLNFACSGRLKSNEKSSVVASDDFLKKILHLRQFQWEEGEIAALKRKGKLSNGDRWKSKYRSPAVVSTDLPELPSGWCWASLNQLSSVITSGSRGWAEFYSDEGAVFIRSQNINRDTLDLTDVAHVMLPSNAEGTRTKILENDLLVIITGANVTKAAIVDRPLSEAYVSQHVALIRPVVPELARFMHLSLMNPGWGRRILGKLAYGAGKPGLNLDNLRDLPIAIPPETEVRNVVEYVDGLLERRKLVVDAGSKAQKMATSIESSAVFRIFGNLGGRA